MNHLHVTCHVCSLKFRHMRQRLIPIIIFMRFKIRLIHKIKSILVAKIIPVGIGGIMAVAHMVDIGTFHHHHVALHIFIVSRRDRVPDASHDG